jgi:HTH-type transcriptional regulator/antitoxin HipB
MAEASSGPGLVRRVRRAAELSQRALAARLGVSQATVARWETGRTSPPLTMLEQMAAVAGLRVTLLDEAGEPAEPMREDAACDRAGRRFPAHVDLRADGWWVPPDSHLTVQGIVARRESREAGLPAVRYAHAVWRRRSRAILGTPVDHPTREELVEAVRQREARACSPAIRTGGSAGRGPD